MKMVPFYGTVYKSSLYDLIIPFPACESGAEREKRRAVVFFEGRQREFLYRKNAEITEKNSCQTVFSAS